jgi:hypothetical protein
MFRAKKELSWEKYLSLRKRQIKRWFVIWLVSLVWAVFQIKSLCSYIYPDADALFKFIVVGYIAAFIVMFVMISIAILLALIKPVPLSAPKKLYIRWLNCCWANTPKRVKKYLLAKYGGEYTKPSDIFIQHLKKIKRMAIIVLIIVFIWLLASYALFSLGYNSDNGTEGFDFVEKHSMTINYGVDSHDAETSFYDAFTGTCSEESKVMSFYHRLGVEHSEQGSRLGYISLRVQEYIEKKLTHFNVYYLFQDVNKVTCLKEKLSLESEAIIKPSEILSLISEDDYIGTEVIDGEPCNKYKVYIDSNQAAPYIRQDMSNFFGLCDNASNFYEIGYSDGKIIPFGQNMVDDPVISNDGLPQVYITVWVDKDSQNVLKVNFYATKLAQALIEEFFGDNAECYTVSDFTVNCTYQNYGSKTIDVPKAVSQRHYISVPRGLF